MTNILLERSIPRIDSDGSRREFLAGLAAAGLLVSCGSSDPPAGPASGTPRSVEHHLGTTTVTGTPRRVVAVTSGLELEVSLSLGIAPIQVGSRATDGQLMPWAAQAYRRLDVDPEVFPVIFGEIDLERIATSDPDLILGQSNFIEDIYPQLSALAPTLPTTFEDFRLPLAELGVLLGREDEVAAIVAEYDRDLARAHARLDLTGTTLGIVGAGYADGFLNVWGSPESAQGQYLAGFGAANVAAEFLGDLSPERLDVIAPADLIVILDYALAGSDPTTTPLWSELPAVAAGRVVELTVAESESLTLTNPLRQPAAIATVERIASV